MAMDRLHSEERGRILWKTSTGLESAGSQKKRKTEANLEEDHYGRSRKMWQNMEPGKRLAGQLSQMEILHKCVMFLMEQMDELLHYYYYYHRHE